MLSIILRIQGAYYVVTGIWPLLSLRTFEWVTGPKTDDWLVYTVGLLMTGIGVVLLVAGGRRRPPGETVLLSVATALSFAAIDTVFALLGRIGSIYLVDAVIEVAFVLVIVADWARSRARG